MLTRANIDSCDLCYREPSIAEVFKEAGYKTYWISNQDLFVGPPVNIFKDNIDEFYPLYDKHKNDKIILPVLKKVLTDNYDKKFIIINLLGNHKYKYPDTYNIYTPNLRTENVTQVSIENKDLFINSYKNQTNFELKVLDQIISEIDRNNLLASLVFASDHGESLFDAPQYYFGHGSVDVPVEQTHIFSFIWMSDRYIRTFPDKKELLNINYNKLANTDCLFYTMADIANISFPKMDKSKSLVKQEYRQLNSIRVIGGDMKIHEVH
jgi:glucan phosphoethanolaminetransferase (alkaline phosphatase superfamily)